MDSYDRIIDKILELEGGFVDHPNDRGGPTNYGITQRTLSDWRGHPVSVEDVRELTEDEARMIYLARYIIEPGFHAIVDPGLRALVIDCGVNHGPDRASRWLQRAAFVNADGIVGPITLHAVNTSEPCVLYHRVLATRASFYGQIIDNDSSQGDFAAGWMNRLAEWIRLGGHLCR